MRIDASPSCRARFHDVFASLRRVDRDRAGNGARFVLQCPKPSGIACDCEDRCAALCERDRTGSADAAARARHNGDFAIEIARAGGLGVHWSCASSTSPCTMRHSSFTTAPGVRRTPYIASNRDATRTGADRGGDIGEIACAVASEISTCQDDRRSAGDAFIDTCRRRRHRRLDDMGAEFRTRTA